MNKTFLLLCSVVLYGTSCYKSLSLDGFDKNKWLTTRAECDSYRITISDHIIENQDVLLEATQNEVESLLGQAEEYELYRRNQKFFHYRLSPPSECGKLEAISYLSIRFNAIGRANLVQVMLREPNN